MPGIDQIVSGRVHVTQLRPVNVEDLLRRDRIDLPGDPVRTLFKGKRVLITGAGRDDRIGVGGAGVGVRTGIAGAGRAVGVRALRGAQRLARDAAWIRSSISSNLVDIGDTEVVEELLSREQPHIVLHAAAHKHVPLGEENPLEYVRNNTIATRRLADICARRGVNRFVFISTDKAINPTQRDGGDKARRGNPAPGHGARGGDEGGHRPLRQRHRFVGQRDSAVRRADRAGGPVTVTHPDVKRYFIRISEAVSLVLQAATLGDGGRIFMLDMGEPVKIVDLATDLIRLSNHREDEIPIVFSGLRPGEKMFEEIHMDGEEIHPTIHPQIVVTEAPQPERHVVERWLAQSAAAAANDAAAVVESLRRLVPEYATLEPAESSAAATRAMLLGRPLRTATDHG
jgi:FlaA1/EpsC-like NDP-sugar epimerase